MTVNIPDEQVIIAAHERIKPFIHNTPVMTCQSINQVVGAEIFFKCENFQKVGAFKARGAMNAVLSLSPDQLANGVATHSSGNHAQAVALAAKTKNTKAYIVMPTTAPKVKKEAVLGYGAQIIECEPTQAARESNLQAVVSETGATAIHPFDNYEVIAGQATAARELFESLPDQHLDYLLAPVGGGGLLSGTALSAKYFSPNTKVVGGEPAGADDTYRSFIAGKITPIAHPKSIADGLLTTIGERNFPIIKENVHEILTVTDEEIISAMRLVWERMKLIIEPSCAVPLAALIKCRENFKSAKVGLILTGGNVDLDSLPFKTI